MTKKEVLEIRHQFAQATCSIDKICSTTSSMWLVTDVKLRQ